MLHRCFFILLSVLPLPLFAQIQGLVKLEDGAPAFGAHVFIHELNRVYSTDAQGRFADASVKTGHYHLHVTFLSYKSADVHIELPLREALVITLEPGDLELQKVVIEDFGTKSVLNDQSQNIQVLQQEDLQKNTGQTFVTALERVPGVQALNTGIGISKPAIRGLGFNRVVVSENGIKQEGQQWGGDHGLEIDGNDVERVEVIKGPAAIIYGSDAITGAINIRPGLPPARNTWSASLLGRFNSVNNLWGQSAAFSVNKNNFWLKARFSTQDYADYKVPADSFVYNSFVLPIENQRIKNTAGRERNASLTAGYSFAKGYTSLRFTYFDQKSGMFPGAHGIPQAYSLQDDGNARNIEFPAQHVKHYKILWNTNIQAGRKNWLEWDAGVQFNDRAELSNPDNHGFGPAIQGNTELAFQLFTASLATRFHHEVNERLSLVYGASGQWQQNRSGGFAFLIPDFRSWQAGAFAYGKWVVQPGKAFLNGGLRVDAGGIQADERATPFYLNSGSQVSGYLRSPRIRRVFGNVSGTLGYSLILRKKHNIKINLGTSYRMPTAPEMTANGVHHGTFRHEQGDSTLRPERGLQFDLYYGRKGSKWEMYVSPFFNYFLKYIFLDPTPNFSPLPEGGLIYRYDQADGIHTGLEYYVDYHIIENLHLGTQGQWVYTYNLESGYNFPFIPPASGRINLEYTIKPRKKKNIRIETGLQGRWAAPQVFTARNELSTPGYMLLDASVTLEAEVRKQQFRLSVSGNNLVNTRYYSHVNRWRYLGLPEPGRNFSLSLQFLFGGSIKSK